MKTTHWTGRAMATSVENFLFDMSSSEREDSDILHYSIKELRKFLIRR